MAQNIGQGQDPYEALQVVVARMVWDDDSLREKIKDSPKDTLEKTLGIKLPDNLNIKVIDETEANTLYLTLPHHPNQVCGFELTPDQLDKVAGGQTALSASVSQFTNFMKPVVGDALTQAKNFLLYG